MIYYTVGARTPEAHLFDIEMIIPSPSPKGQRVSLPSWVPGSYLIRDFSRHIVSINAMTQETLEPLALKKVNSHTYECEPTDKGIVLQYQIYAFDNSVRGAYLDTLKGFFNGGCLFLKAHGQELSKCHVTLCPPDVEGAKDWRVATPLSLDEASIWGYGSYFAHSYEELVDSPVHMGHFHIQKFSVHNKTHYIVIDTEEQADFEKLTQDVKCICEKIGELFGSSPPFDQYLFLLKVVPGGYGGLEHQQSSSLMIQPEALPLEGQPADSAYISLLGLFSHEYFHAWNVKRIRPEVFVTPDLGEKVYTEQLWAFEGITSYYDDLMLLRSKRITLPQYLDLISQTLTRVYRGAGREVQTLAESSFDAWTKFYQRNENTENAVVSYYLKGMMAALIFDLALRKETKQRTSLDTMMQHLWEHYGRLNKGVPEKTIEAMLGQFSDGKLNALVQQAIYTTEELPLSSLLDTMGLRMTLRERFSESDRGGVPASGKIKTPASNRGDWGMRVMKCEGRVNIASVAMQRAAMTAGLSPHDELCAIDKKRVTPQTVDAMMERACEGQTVSLYYFRQGKLRETALTLGAMKKDTVEIRLKETLSEQEEHNLERWIEGK